MILVTEVSHEGRLQCPKFGVCRATRHIGSHRSDVGICYWRTELAIGEVVANAVDTIVEMVAAGQARFQEFAAEKIVNQ
jgi:hypothetical protein